MDIRVRKLKLNNVSSLIYQVLLIAVGFILPRLFLSYYGSETYGLISSIGQFLSVTNIADLGISAVIGSAYYKPLAEKNSYKVNGIFNASKKFFLIIGIFFVVYTVTVSFTYPLFTDSPISYISTVILFCALALSQLAQSYIGISYQLLLSADQKLYVPNFINGATLILNTALSVILIVNGVSIEIVKLISALVYILRPVLLYFYAKSHYDISRRHVLIAEEIPQRLNGIFQHVSYYITTNTDVIILTLCSTFLSVSVYSVYLLVLGSVNMLIGSVFNGYQPFFGNMIANGEREKFNDNFDKLEFFSHGILTVIFSATAVLIVPFILLYTANINDVNYNEGVFALLITVATFFLSLRTVYFTLVKAVGHYRETQWFCLAEALINVTLSLILVFKFNLSGVAIGTLVSTVFYVVYLTIYVKKNIIKPKRVFPIKQYLTDALVFIGVIFLSKLYGLRCVSFLDWILNAVVITLTALSLTLLLNLALNYKKTVSLLKIEKR